MFVPALLLLGGPKVYAPKLGSPERKAIMDGLRLAVTPSVKQAVIFKTQWIRSNGEWAFLSGTPQKPNGKPLDYSKTEYARYIHDGVFDDGFSAVMHRQGKRWRAVEWQIGATDVAWWDAWNRTRAPRALFPGGSG